jgi:CDP-diacylglycerol--serine O-phosphatidyltransferase
MTDRPQRRLPGGIPLRALAPNAVTALALCSGLTGVRFAISLAWEKAVLCVLLAGILDGLDGRIARMLKGESRFGAELDSLSDVIAFGVSPAIIIYLWSLQQVPQYGWIIALAHAVCCALRLARFNANIDATVQPHKSAGFMTGIPAPAGAGLMLLPIYLWLWTGLDIFRQSLIVAPWVAVVALLMISSVATFSWSSLRLRRGIRLWVLLAVALIGTALINEPWISLSVLCLLYLIGIPLSIRSYSKVRRLAAARAPATPS